LLVLQSDIVLLKSIVGARDGWLLVTREQARCPFSSTAEDVIDERGIIWTFIFQGRQAIKKLFHFLVHLNASLGIPTLRSTRHVQDVRQAQDPFLPTINALVDFVPLVPSLSQGLDLDQQRVSVVL